MPAAMASRHNQVGIKMAALGAATVFAASLSFQTASAPSGILSATAAATAAFAAVFAARVGFAAAVPVRGAPRRAEKVVRACGTWSVSSGGGITSSSSSFMGSSMAGSVTGPVATPSNSSGSALSSMSMMFERFNEKAIKAVMMAQEESRRLGHNYVGTEMLLVGVVADTSGPSGKVLKKFNVTLKETRKTMEEMVGRGTGMVSVEIPFTPAAKRVLGDGVEEAKRLNANTIDTAHILLALLKEDNGNAVKILEKLGVDPSKMPDEIIKELQEKDERSLVGVTSRGGGSGKTVTLEEFGNDLTKAAEEGKMDPLVGRAAELERTIQILARRQKNNPVLIGEPGVGKTAIAEGLAQKIVAGDVPELLQGLISRKRIVQLDLAMLLAGTRYRGEFEERLKNVIKEVLDSKKQIILMIDEIHTIVGAGGTGDGGGAIDAGNIMKPALSRGELQVIGATTIEEYRKYIEKDKALERRFQPVNVPEPTNEETLTILQGLAKKYEDIMATIATPPMREVFLRILHWFDLFLGDPQEHHKLKYTDEALAACVKFASQYIQDRFLPDKAIDVLDETGARVRLRESSILPEEAKEAQQKLKEEANLRTKIKSIISESKAAIVDEDEEEDESDDKPRKQILVTEADVAAVVSKWTGVPVEKVSSDEGARLVKLEEVQPIIGPKIYHSASHAQGSPLMFDGLSWCAGFVKKNFTGDCHTSDDVESVEIPVNIPVKIEDVDISFEVKPASSTHSGSRASVSRLESCLELFSDFERVESEAISLMTTELSQQSFLVDVEEVLHKRPLCSTSHCQISTVQWRGQTVAMKEVILGCPFRCFQIAF
eukprot:s462_g35.t1